MTRNHRYTRVVLLGLIAALVATGCSGGKTESTGKPGGRTAQETQRLRDAQVTDYQGKKLDSFEDFRENSIKGPQAVDIETYRMTLRGEVDSPTVLTYDEVLELPTFEKVVRLDCVEGWGATILWKGVRITDLLERAGYHRDGATVIFHCEDGYTTSLPLSVVIGRDLLLAYQMNGIDLPTERGYPFQVVAEDKWGYKWAKWVTAIEVSDDADYQGYWESRGYDNDATLPSK